MHEQTVSFVAGKFTLSVGRRRPSRLQAAVEFRAEGDEGSPKRYKALG